MKKQTTTLNILMVGAMRAGKSSTLSSMIESLSLSSETMHVKPANDSTEKEMRNKRAHLKKIFSTENIQRGIWIDDGSGRDKSISTYEYVIEIHEYLDINLKCIDVPGEYIENNINNLLVPAKKSNVIIVAIDTPQLMENGKIGENKNCIGDITDLLSKAITEDSNFTGKEILFVPVKCEKYFHTNQMNKVGERIKNAYSSLISLLKTQPNSCAYIIPVLTVGDLEFKEFKGASSSSAVAYYEFTGNKNFSPRYCEQPILYAIKYVMDILFGKSI